MNIQNPVYYLSWLLLLLLSACAVTPKPEPVIQQSAPDLSYADHERQRWLAWHQDWTGTPHRLGGNSRKGIDCSAYVKRGYEELYRIQLPRTAKSQRKKGQSIKYSQLETGDLVFFRQSSYPHHVGVYLGDGTFVHVSSSKGVTRSRLDKGYWNKYFSQGRRVME